MASPGHEFEVSKERQVRLRSLQPDELPQHPLLPGSTKPIGSFVSSILEEGHEYSDLPKFEASKTKHSPPAKAPVEVSWKEERASDIPIDRRDQYPQEWWFARKSIHQNAAEPGTASWQEFDGGLRVNHSQNEKEYTPDLMDAHEVITYREQLQEIGQQAGRWSDVTCNIMEVC